MNSFYPGTPAPVDVVAGVAVGVDCDVEAEDGKMQDPLPVNYKIIRSAKSKHNSFTQSIRSLLGLVFTMAAVPPKSQLVGNGFF